jgi:hypothetical protein
MTPQENAARRGESRVLLDRRFVACRECGWVHYVMTVEEKTASDRMIERYHLNEEEQRIYELAFRQCLRCEAPAAGFRAANESDLDRAAGHIVTPVLAPAKEGTPWSANRSGIAAL